MDASSVALVVVDVQNDFVHEHGGAASLGYEILACQEAMPSVLSAIAGAREVGARVIYVRTEHVEWTDSAAWKQRLQGRVTNSRLCEPGSWGSEFYQLAPVSDEPIVTKHRYSGFIGTDLQLILRSIGATQLAFAGFAANVCVESTLRDAYMLDFEVTLLNDATAGAFSSEELAGTVENVRKFFGDVLTTEEWLERVRGGHSSGQTVAV